MVYGEGADKGILRGRDFYHGNMGFAVRFPERWPIQNLPDRLISGAPGSLAILQVMVQGVDTRLSPMEYMAQHMGLPSNRNGESLTINGLPAYTQTAVIETNAGKRLSRIAVIYLDNLAYIFVGFTRDTNGLNRYDTNFLNTIRSFRPLSNAERQVANLTNRIRLVRAGSATDFDQLASISPLEKFPEEQLRLINAEYPRGDIENGQLIKIIEQN